jgi:uncharacterized protein (TIGR02452 family)
MMGNKKAINHVKNMKEQYDKEISHSIQNTTAYRGGTMIIDKEKETVMNIRTVPMDTVSAIIRLYNGKTAALNFASYKNPGGGFIKGSVAQEEDLCRCSTLYPVLASQQQYYDDNKKSLNDGLYTEAALYSEDILFMSDEGPVKCDVITCASPNWGAAKRNGVSRIQNTKALKNRIEFLLCIAAYHGVETLILGAWGCDVFRQEAVEVAELFQNALQKYPYFKNVIFAIPSGNNFDMFKEVFGE